MIQENKWLGYSHISNYFFSFIGDSRNSFIGYRPLVWASLSLEKSILGDAAWHFRVFNILVHAMNACLVFALCRDYFNFKFNQFVICLLVLLFLIHPIHVNVIQLVWKRSDLLVNTGILGAILFYSRNAYGRGFLFSLIAFFSKENAAVLLPSLLLYDFCSHRKILDRRRMLFVYAPVFFLTVIHLWVCFVIWPEKIGELGLSQAVFTHSDFQLGAIDYAKLQIASLPSYVALFFLPMSLRVFHFIEAVKNIWTFQFLLGWTLLFSFGVLAARSIRKKRMLLFCVGWFLLQLLPTSSFIPLHLPFDEDRLYGPLQLIPFMILAMCTEKKELLKSKVMWLCVLSYALFFIFQTRHYQSTWISSSRLWSQNILYEPNDPRPWLALGLNRLEMGEHKKGLSLIEEANKRDLNSKSIHYYLALAQMHNQEWKAAISNFTLSLKYEIFEAQSFMYLGNIYANLKETNRALEYFDRSIEANYLQIESYKNKAKLLTQLRRYSEAIKVLRSAMLANPQDVSIYEQLLDVLRTSGVPREKMELLEQTKQQQPSLP